ncbi:MAG: hypothetical protein H0T17_06510 [Propionibacteriales bacterium]|nr:hypothetical protein [Propionibacteriales bacterium]
MLIRLAEDYAAAELGDHLVAVRLLAAADATRERLATPRPPSQQAEIAKPIAKTRAGLTAQEWDDAYRAGCSMTVEDTLTQAHQAAL